MSDARSDRGEPWARLAAAGDLLLGADPTGRAAPRDPWTLFEAVRPVLAECDVAVANLECTLPGGGEVVPTEPRVITTPQLVQAVRSAGIGVVCLANNHAFDCLPEGFRRTKRLLAELGVASFGAGEDLDEASAPALVEVRGVRLAFLGAVDERSGADRFAGPGRWGVWRLDVPRMAERIAALRRQVDCVVVSLHWGHERFMVPSPLQMADARALAEAGAGVILGHHPHVLQGMELHRGVPIVYSLGNLVASEVYFSDGDAVTWDRTGRTGCILLAEVGPGGARDVRQVPTFDDGRGVRIDRSGFGDRRIARCNRAIARGVSLRRYRREHLWVNTIRPALGYLRWSRLRKLRLRQVRKAFAALLGARKAK